MSPFQGMSSRLLTMPLEVREEIYRKICYYESWLDTQRLWDWKMAKYNVDEDSAEGRKPHWVRHDWMAILLTCHQVHDEAEPLLYQSIRYQPDLGSDSAYSLFQSLSRTARLNITKLHIQLNVADSHTETDEATTSLIDCCVRHLPHIRSLNLRGNEKNFDAP